MSSPTFAEPVPQSDTRTFHIGDILTVINDTFVSPNGSDGVFGLLAFLTGDEHLFIHQMPNAADMMVPWLREQFPDLAEVDCSPVRDAATFVVWMDLMVKKYGETREVTRPPREMWGKHNPITELAEMVGPEKIIAIVMPDPNES